MGSLAQGLIGFWSFHTATSVAAYMNLACPGKTDITEESAVSPGFTVIAEFGRGMEGTTVDAGARAYLHVDHRAPVHTIIWWGFHIQAGANDWQTRFGIFHRWDGGFDLGAHAVSYDRQGWGQIDQWGYSTNDGSGVLSIVYSSLQTTHPGGTTATLYGVPISVAYVRTSGRVDAYRNGQAQWFATSGNNGPLGLPSYTSTSHVYFANGAPNPWAPSGQRNAQAHCAGTALWDRALTPSEIARFDRDPYIGLRAV